MDFFVKIQYLRVINFTSWFIISLVFAVYFILTFFVIAGVDDLFFIKFTALYGFIKANIFFYNSMGGRYFSNVLMTICGASTHTVLDVILCEPVLQSLFAVFVIHASSRL